MDGLRLHWEALTIWDLVLVAAMFLSVVALAVVLVRAAARERVLARQRYAAWARHYFHEGGLIRELISRWSGPPRLTDRREGRDGD